MKGLKSLALSNLLSLPSKSPFRWSRFTFVQALQAVALIVLLATIGAILMANVWDFIGWMRTFGIDGAVMDKADLVRRALALETHSAQGVPFQIAEEIINGYSRTFVGHARFGSGLGIFAGTFIALSYLKERSAPVRIAAGTFAGALIGARFCLLISSKLVPFFFFVFAGAVIVGALMSIRQSQLSRLRTLAYECNRNLRP
jgi:hypothetical protein